MPRRSPGAFLIATWFGCGYAPKAPGTAGSLAGLVIAIALYYVGYGRGALLRAYGDSSRAGNLVGQCSCQRNRHGQIHKS